MSLLGYSCVILNILVFKKNLVQWKYADHFDTPLYVYKGMQKNRKIQKLQNWPQVALPSVIFVLVSFSKHVTFFFKYSFPLSFEEYLDTKIYSKHGIIASSTFHFLHICRTLQFLQLNLMTKTCLPSCLLICRVIWWLRHVFLHVLWFVEWN